MRAIVRTVTGSTTHLEGRFRGEIEYTPLPDPVSVEVVEHEGAIYLLRFDSNGECIADTWHDTVDAAKAQADFEFGITDNDWTDTDAQG
jgi:hypothetical protein